MNHKAKMLYVLQKLNENVQQGEDYNERHGICSNVRVLLSERSWYDIDYHYYLGELFVSWPKYSGDEAYPVPSPAECDSASAYNDACNMWVGKYGDLRVELLHHCIQELEKVVTPEELRAL